MAVIICAVNKRFAQVERSVFREALEMLDHRWKKCVNPKETTVKIKVRYLLFFYCKLVRGGAKRPDLVRGSESLVNHYILVRVLFTQLFLDSVGQLNQYQNLKKKVHCVFPNKIIFSPDQHRCKVGKPTQLEGKIIHKQYNNSTYCLYTIGL